MDQTTDHIRRDIDATRDSMTEKLAQIEDKVKGSVDDLKGTVNDTVDQVKQAFDLNQQVQDRPWTMLGASLLAGYILGSLGGDDNSNRYQARSSYGSEAVRYSPQNTQSQPNSQSSDASNYSNPYSGGSYSSSSNASNSQPGFFSDVMDQFRDEIDTLKGAAIVTVTNMLRDTLKTNLPQFADEFERARNEREEQRGNSTSTSQSYDPLAPTPSTPTDRDASYQTHSTTPAVYPSSATSDATRNSL